MCEIPVDLNVLNSVSALSQTPAVSVISGCYEHYETYIKQFTWCCIGNRYGRPHMCCWYVLSMNWGWNKSSDQSYFTLKGNIGTTTEIVFTPFATCRFSKMAVLFYFRSCNLSGICNLFHNFINSWYAGAELIRCNIVKIMVADYLCHTIVEDWHKM